MFDDLKYEFQALWMLVGPEVVGRLDLVLVALGVTLLVVGLVAAAAGVLRVVARIGSLVPNHPRFPAPVLVTVMHGAVLASAAAQPRAPAARR